ncbi:MAG: Gx transporter family protein [Bacillota bacterium]|nr:Gx transporter family protein [Bacillota bacterium]
MTPAKPEQTARARRLTQFSLLVATAVVLHVVESMFPPPLPVPGARLGLANIVSLVCLDAFGARAAFLLAGMRTVLGGLLGGGLLGFGFLLSFGAALASVAGMALLRSVGRERFSIVGLSLFGALVHNVTQLTLAALIVRHAGVFAYLPYMLMGSLPTGALTGVAATYVLRARNAAFAMWLGAAQER